MSDVISLKAQLRTSVGTGSARELRRNGLIPSTIYGGKSTPISIALEEKEITKFYKRPQYITQLFEFDVEGTKYNVLPKDIQMHPISDTPIHADFVLIESDFQKMFVPIVYQNKENCIGVKRGGYFNIVKRKIEILCPIQKLPRKIELDVTDMRIGRSIKAQELALPEGAKLLSNPKFVIASIIGKKGKDGADDGDQAAA